MKKLFLILVALTFFAPSLVSAQETTTAEPAGACNVYRCHCSWFIPPIIVAYGTGGSGAGTIPDPMNTKTSEDCKATCIGLSGASTPEEENQVTSTFTCEVGAATITPKRDPIVPVLNVKIPGLCDMSEGGICWEGLNTTTTSDGTQHSNLLGFYVNAVYIYLIGAGALIATTMLMIAGIQYATARGDSKQVDHAKKRIGNAVAGIILLLLAYNIAFLINPATTTFEALSLKSIDPILYVNNSGDYSGAVDFSQVVKPGPVICDQSSSVYDIAKSMEGNVTYRLGGKGGPPPYPYDSKKDGSGVGYKTYCPEGQLCLDCSGYAAYLASCAGLSPAGESGGTTGIFASAEKVTSCTNDAVNGKTLNPGDMIGWSAMGTGYGHVFTYVGQGKISDSAGSGRSPGRAVSMKDTTWACNNYMNEVHGLYVVRRAQ